MLNFLRKIAMSESLFDNWDDFMNYTGCATSPNDLDFIVVKEKTDDS